MGGNLLREGSNGWTCLPANPRGQSDPENGWVDAHEAMPFVEMQKSLNGLVHTLQEKPL